MKRTPEQIERLIKSQVRFWKYDNREDVMVNKWTVANHGDFGFYPNGIFKPEFDTKEQAEEEFKKHLMSL